MSDDFHARLVDAAAQAITDGLQFDDLPPLYPQEARAAAEAVVAALGIEQAGWLDDDAFATQEEAANDDAALARFKANRARTRVHSGRVGVPQGGEVSDHTHLWMAYTAGWRCTICGATTPIAFSAGGVSPKETDT